jgi:hypothetical protein
MLRLFRPSRTPEIVCGMQVREETMNPPIVKGTIVTSNTTFKMVTWFSPSLGLAALSTGNSSLQRFTVSRI